MTRNTAGSLLSVPVGRCPTVPYFRVTTGKIDVRVIKKIKDSKYVEWT